MDLMKKADCEHCHRFYRYSLWHSGFGDNAYAYCDLCGMLATFSYSNRLVANLQALSARFQEIDAEWEPFLSPCSCGGHFRKGASPRCPYCHQRLSPIYAARHFEQNSRGSSRDWKWQGNWTGIYCLSIEDPTDPGTLLHITDPICQPEAPPKAKTGWNLLFSFRP
jgi:hypothetical protein